MWRSLPQIETALTSMRTSSSPKTGSGTSRSSINPLPLPYFTTAFIATLPGYRNVTLLPCSADR